MLLLMSPIIRILELSILSSSEHLVLHSLIPLLCLAAEWLVKALRALVGLIHDNLLPVILKNNSKSRRIF